MTIGIDQVARDEVILSAFATGQTSYRAALEKLVPLMGRFEEQRKTQRPKFYARLREDILRGCVMPPITIAFVEAKIAKRIDRKTVSNFVNENISKGYILDGLQRLNTLISASEDDAFDYNRPLFLNVIIAEKYDMLLYRMITLNNGQKPMTPRHQIEILTKNIINLEKFKNINVQTEKDTEDGAARGSFRLGDISSGYTAFLTNNVNNENKKIIEEKMNEILVNRVMESHLNEIDVKFEDIVVQIDRLSENENVKKWLKFPNNLIGFVVGAKYSIKTVKTITPDEFEGQIQKFEQAFAVINPSKVNVGRYRRELSSVFIRDLERFAASDYTDVSEAFVDATIND